MTTNLQLSQPLVVPAGSGPAFDLGDHRGQVKVSARNSNGDFLLVEMEADKGGGVPPHIHRREDETFYILEGRFIVVVGTEIIEAGAGDTVFAPRDIAHTWRCVSEEGGRALLLVTPGENFEAFAMEMAQHRFEPAAAMSDPTVASEFMGLTERFGIEMLLPTK